MHLFVNLAIMLKLIKEINCWRQIFLLCILLSPLFFINIKNSFDWGDDYAHYILKAKDIATGSSIAKLMEDENYAPSIRPPVFPALLSPVYSCFGAIPAAYHFFSSIVLLLVLVVSWIYFFKNENMWLGVLFASSIAFIPYTLKLKAELPIELPMMLFIYSSLLLIKLERYALAFAFIIIACLTKYTAVAMIPVFAFAYVINCMSKGAQNKKQLVAIIAMAVLLLADVLFNFSSVTWYQQHFISGNIFERIANNFNYYMHVFFNAFEQEVPSIINVVIKWLVIVLFLSGFVLSVSKRLQAHDIFFVFYLLIILIYDYGKGGYRFIFPLFPVVFFYFYRALNFLSDKLKLKALYLSMAFVLVLMISFSKNIIKIKEEEILVTGPQQTEFTQICDYVKNNTPDSITIFFAKPFLTILYSERKSKWIKSISSLEAAQEKSSSYILLAKSTEAELYLSEFDYLLKSNVVVEENNKFILLKNQPATFE